MKTTLVVGVVVAILVLVGVLAIFLNVGKHSVTTSSKSLPPVSLPFTTSTTTTTTTQSSSSTTTVQSSTTSTTTQPSQIQPDEIYFLNYSNGTYWYVVVLNVSLPNTVNVGFVYENVCLHYYNVQTYHLYGYSEVLLPLKTPFKVTGIISVINIGYDYKAEGFAVRYDGYNWTYGGL